MLGLYDSNDYRYRIAETIARSPAHESIPSTSNVSTEIDPESTPIYTQVNKSIANEGGAREEVVRKKTTIEEISDEILEQASKKIKYCDQCDNVLRENLVKIWAEILRIEKKVEASSAISANNTNNSSNNSDENEVSISC